jgi:hypothetical protein
MTSAFKPINREHVGADFDGTVGMADAGAFMYHINIGFAHHLDDGSSAWSTSCFTNLDAFFDNHLREIRVRRRIDRR